MTQEEKIAAVQTILNGDSDATPELVTLYLSLAKQKILDRLYPFADTSTKDVPAGYGHLHCELAARLFLRRGGEGESSHEENGVNRVYGSVDDEDILSRLTPFAAVM